MNKLNSTAFLLLLFVSFYSVSCKKTKEGTIYSNNNVQMTPATGSTATGTMTLSYNDLTKTLSYTVTYNNLGTNPTALHVHGIAGTGVKGPHVQINTSGFTNSSAGNGSYNGTLFVDGVVIKEEDLLAGQYYIDLHTAAFPANVTAGPPPGYALENPILRGQITFQ